MDYKDRVGKNFFLRTINIDDISFDILDFFELDIRRYPFLLESSAVGNDRARFSILFSKPSIQLIKKKKDDNINFLKELDLKFKKGKVSQEKIYIDKNITLPFTGGWFLYLGYELVSEIEHKIKIPESPFQLPTAFLARVKNTIIFDQKEKKLYLVSEESMKEVEKMYTDFKTIKKPRKKNIYLKNNIKITKKGSDLTHNKDVNKCIDYIFQGEIFQANLSRLWEFNIDKTISNLDIYRQLRITNPSPFAGIVNISNSCIISSSPERLACLKGEFLETRPIAGTRPRGSNGFMDIELSRELISSEKERAEHLMLVDLERNDISRVCQYGSVKVDEMMVIESYSHVHHIVSNIKGKIKRGVKIGEIISAVFPGGTITGCPKVRCMEILGELEKIGRGPYTGSFGYINHFGDLDLNILIRTMVRENETLSLRAGGGIVADSIPDKELLETEAKANGMLKALQKINYK